jgi:hypothetical protein
MRIVLGTHLQQLRALRAPVEHIALVERELAKYGGDPSRPEG